MQSRYINIVKCQDIELGWHQGSVGVHLETVSKKCYADTEFACGRLQPDVAPPIDSDAKNGVAKSILPDTIADLGRKA